LRAAAVVLLTAFDYASPVLSVLGVRHLVDAAGVGDADRALFGLALLVLTVAAGQGAGFAAFALGIGLRERVGHRIELDIASTVAARPDIEHLERPEYLDRLLLLGEPGGDLARLPDAVVQAIGVAVRLVASLGLLVSIDGRLLALAACGLPSVAGTAITARLVRRRDEARAPVQRRAAILNAYTRLAATAQELRVFGAGPELQRRIHDDRVAADDIIRRSNLRITAVQGAGWLVFGAGFVAAVVFVARGAAQGRYGAGEVAMVVTIGAQLNGQLGAVSTWLAGLADLFRVAGHYRWLRSSAPPRPDDAVDPGRGGVTLDDVSFRYPGTTRDVLRNISLTVPAGATLALVGENGAGKTTLVKLLTGLYAPTSGAITVAGAALGEIDPRAWRARLSGAFQDTPILEFRVHDVVGLGDVDLVDDTDAVEAAVIEGGAQELVASLAQGLGTPLGKSFDGGTQLSGGQWQRLALARAMMRRAPVMLLLDEPTANLDPQAEAALFERHARAMASAGRADGSAVLISHRVSTVQPADHIVVLDDGRIVEQGSHHDLLAAGGLYAELFRLQASGYAS
jgi:ABC-type multidrug transport system fused ATPase/permease subunit